MAEKRTKEPKIRLDWDGGEEFIDNAGLVEKQWMYERQLDLLRGLFHHPGHLAVAVARIPAKRVHKDLRWLFELLAGRYRQSQRAPDSKETAAEIERLLLAISEKKRPAAEERLVRIVDHVYQPLEEGESFDYSLEWVYSFAHTANAADLVAEMAEGLRADDLDRTYAAAQDLSRQQRVITEIHISKDWDKTWEDRQEQRKAASQDKSERPVSFGIYDEEGNSFDTCTGGGLHRRRLACVQAKAKAGKTLFMTLQAWMGYVSGLNVLYVALEQSQQEIEDKLDSMFLGFSALDIQHAKIPDGMEAGFTAQFRQLQEKQRGGLRVQYLDEDTTNIQSIYEVLDMYADAGFPVDMLVLDYADLLFDPRTLSGPNRLYANKIDALDRVYRDLKVMAVRRNLYLWTASQSRRGKNTMDGEEVADSYGKIRIVDLMFSIDRERKEDKQTADYVKISLPVVRNGVSDATLTIVADYSRMRLTRDVAMPGDWRPIWDRDQAADDISERVQAQQRERGKS